MVNFKIKAFNNDLQERYHSDFNNQIKFVKDAVLTLEEAIKLLEKECLNEMEDKCKLVVELEKESKFYGDKLIDVDEKNLILGPDNINYINFSKIMRDIGEKAKNASELLIDIKYDKVPNDLTKELVKLIEIDESISRNIYLTMKKMNEVDIKEIKKLSCKLQKKQKDVEDISNKLLDDSNHSNDEFKLSDNYKDLIAILKGISNDSQKVFLIIK